MDKKTFDTIRGIVYDVSGINLVEGKEALVSARISKRMRRLGIPDFSAYLQYLKNDNSGQELVALIDVISTNVTSFYREIAHFHFLEKIIAEWMQQGQSRFRIWSAASSSGEEPYSIAITMLETLKGQSADVKILATDISTNVLEKCEIAEYNFDKIKPVPPILREKYFKVIKSDDDKLYKVKDNVKKLLVFNRLNLAQVPYPMKGPLDLVFCRNVMIYFDATMRKKLLTEIYRLLKPGGYLLIGHSESLTGLDTAFQAIGPSIYIKDE